MSYKKWLYRNELGEMDEFCRLEDFPEDTIGFVYKVTNICDGRIYVGKKVLYNNLTKTLTKKEIAEWDKPGRVPKKKKIQKESDWETYWGSNKQIKQDLKDLGEDCFIREILTFCRNKKQLTYYEVYWQMNLSVLAIDSYNDNIQGRFYRKDLE
jgi:hypothetical protein